MFSCEINSSRNIRNNEGRNYIEKEEHENVQDIKLFKKEENKNMQDIKLFKCKYCNFTSKWTNIIKSHEKVLHANELILFTCQYCDFTSKGKQNMRRHEEMQHVNIVILLPKGKIILKHTKKCSMR